MLDTSTRLAPLLQLMEKAKAENEPWAAKQAIVVAQTGDVELAEDLAKKLSLKGAIDVIDPYPFPRPLESEVATEGDPGQLLLLGRIKHTTSLFTVYILDLLKHFLLLGRTGSGKTSLIYWVIIQCIMKGIKVWVLDREKQDYRHLIQFRNGILVIQLGLTFKINLLAVPSGVDPKQWLHTFAEILCRTLSLLDGSMSLLIVLLDELYREFGVYDGAKNFPALHDLFLKCLGLKVPRYGRETGFRDSILNRLKALLALHGGMFDCSVGFPLEELAERNVVFESAGLPEKHFQLLANVMLHWLMLYRIANQQRGEGIKNLVVIDECKWLFSPFVNENIGWPPITYMLAQLREFGVGILATDQTANLNEALFVNSFTKIAMAMGSGQDLLKIKRTFSLDDEQLDYMQRLKVGEACVRHPNFAKPFAIEIPRFPLG